MHTSHKKKKHIHNMMDDKLLVQTLPLSLNASTRHFRPEPFIVILAQFTNNVLSTRLTENRTLKELLPWGMKHQKGRI